jgi:hypothetical protein
MDHKIISYFIKTLIGIENPDFTGVNVDSVGDGSHSWIACRIRA